MHVAIKIAEKTSICVDARSSRLLGLPIQHDVNFKGIPLTTVNGSVLKLSSAVLAPGLYLGIHLKELPDINYTYLFPTIYNFGDARYKLTLLTGTNFVLDVQSE